MDARRKFAVAGATGRVGQHVVELLAEQGHEVVAMSRSGGVDVVTGKGLDEALTGVDTIIDVSSTPSPDQQEATDFFTAAAGNLHEAGTRAGVRRLVVVSIIGIDRGFTTGYNAAKLAHERAALAGPVPTQILRAAQFHEFVPQLLQWGTQGETAYVPEMRTQLVAARTVAEALVAMAAAPAPEPGTVAAPFPEIAGPREEDLAHVASLYSARHGSTVNVVSVTNPDDPDAHLFANGSLLPSPHAKLAGPTFEEWANAER
jgi:uncharacterized protein YbjT (DUF2867 family)